MEFIQSMCVIIMIVSTISTILCCIYGAIVTVFDLDFEFLNKVVLATAIISLALILFVPIIGVMTAKE